MAKQYDLQQFRFTLPDGRDVLIAAWRYEYARGWGHKATIVYIGDDWVNYTKRNWVNYTKRITYYNRTWEAFTYESVLHKVIREFWNGKADKINRDYLIKQCDAIAQHEAEACERFCKAFQSAYNGLTGEQKQRLADADIHITNEEQAKTALKMVQSMALVNA